MILYLIGGVACALGIWRERRMSFWMTVILILIWPLPLGIAIWRTWRDGE